MSEIVNSNEHTVLAHKLDWNIGIKTAICRDLPAQVYRTRHICGGVRVVWQCYSLDRRIEREGDITIEQAVALCEMDAVRELAKLYKKVSEFYGEIKC